MIDLDAILRDIRYNDYPHDQVTLDTSDFFALVDEIKNLRGHMGTVFGYRTLEPKRKITMNMFDTSDSPAPIIPGDLRLKVPEQSEWCCELFGMGTDFVFYPTKGHEPNWFWRQMQWLVFGNRWYKKEKKS